MTQSPHAEGIALGRDEDRPQRPWLVIVAAVVLLVLGAALWWLWPEDPSDAAADAPGQGAIGMPPGSGSAGSAPSSVGAPGAVDATSPARASDAARSPGSPVPPLAPPDVRQGPLLVHTEIPKANLLSYTVRVIVSNPGDEAGSWRSVALRLSGANLSVSPTGTVVGYEYHAPAHCLVAPAAITLNAGESITLDATVGALVAAELGGVQSARLDEAPCPA